jgi:vibriolysin
VFNKAFYLLANTAGWNTQTAFQVMALANQTYWTAQSTFDAAAAFAGVGVQTCDVIIDPPDNVLFNGVPRIISGDLRSEIVFTLEAPQQVISTRFDISGGIGDADIYVKFGSAPTTSDYDCHHIDSKYDKHECFGTKNAYKK